MEEIKEIEKIIYKMRQSLYEIINNEKSLLDIEVIAASQKLDDIINQYNELLDG
ncbi:aspartyl-phosphate phosphatase Spo0E family protein [Clostridium beijerinckii]|uniref:aspartyl-phosphate phosphatase Spo0E family protein n=1 Tax=Clostridium beijerinckii TaxID=1520 RepID=UPI00047BD247|nr:aspartyl-phosphate phosphatase Spo0E family protein [Clostridium beijerinckii]